MKKLLAVLVIASVFLGLASCSDDVELNGTTWKTSFSASVPFESYSDPVDVTLNGNVVFTGDKSGVMLMIVEFGDMKMADVSSFTYTFDGESKGSITTKDEDTVEVMNFSYNTDTKSLSIDLPDDMSADFGLKRLAFTESKALPEISNVRGTTWTYSMTESENYSETWTIDFTSATKGTITRVNTFDNQPETIVYDIDYEFLKVGANLTASTRDESGESSESMAFVVNDATHITLYSFEAVRQFTLKK